MYIYIYIYIHTHTCTHMHTHQLMKYLLGGLGRLQLPPRAGAGHQGLQGYGLSILRIGYLVPRMLLCVFCLLAWRFFESRDV